MRPDRPVGAYGLTFAGVPGRLLLPVPPSANWPHVSVATTFETAPMPRGGVGPDKAFLPLVDGSWVALDRRNQLATVMGGPSGFDELLHPFLATAAVVFSWWHGRSAFHGGAFARPGGPAWALLGQRGAGKSSTLAALAAAGAEIVADDLLVVEDGDVFAGPRLLDLRPDAAGELGALGASAVRAGARHRLELGPVTSQLPLAGWIFLTWGSTVSLTRLTPGEWLERATSHMNTVTTGSPSILALSGAEAWQLTRPHELASLEAAVDELRTLAGI